MKDTYRGENAAPDLLTIPEVAAILRLKPNTVYKLAETDDLPGLRRFGRTIRIHRETLLAYLASGERGSKERAR